MSVSKEIGVEIMSDYLQTLIDTIRGGENTLIPVQLSPRVLMFLHRGEVTERLLDEEPQQYDKPYYTLCFEVVTDDEGLYDHLTQAASRLAEELRRQARDS